MEVKLSEWWNRPPQERLEALRDNNEITINGFQIRALVLWRRDILLLKPEDEKILSAKGIRIILREQRFYITAEDFFKNDESSRQSREQWEALTEEVKRTCLRRNQEIYFHTEGVLTPESELLLKRMKNRLVWERLRDNICALETFTKSMIATMVKVQKR